MGNAVTETERNCVGKGGGLCAGLAPQAIIRLHHTELKQEVYTNDK